MRKAISLSLSLLSLSLCLLALLPMTATAAAAKATTGEGHRFGGSPHNPGELIAQARQLEEEDEDTCEKNPDAHSNCYSCTPRLETCKCFTKKLFLKDVEGNEDSDVEDYEKTAVDYIALECMDIFHYESGNAESDKKELKIIVWKIKDPDLNKKTIPAKEGETSPWQKEVNNYNEAVEEKERNLKLRYKTMKIRFKRFTEDEELPQENLSENLSEKQPLELPEKQPLDVKDRSVFCKNCCEGLYYYESKMCACVAKESYEDELKDCEGMKEECNTCARTITRGGPYEGDTNACDGDCVPVES